MKESLESLYEYQSNNKKIIVSETLFEADDKSGPIGNIIDKALSFVPRAVRFKKAKKTMRAAISKFDEKARKVIAASKKSIAKRVNEIEKQYNEMKASKIKPLMDEGKFEQAASILNSEISEYESYKKEIMASMEKSVDNVLSEYTKAIETRIDKPGFVFNVELSDRGKGELKAKWQEQVSVQKLKIDEYKMQVATAAGLSKLNNMIAEMKGYIEEKRYSAGKSALDFYVQQVVAGSRNGEFELQIQLRAPASRLKVKEKGIVWGPDETGLDIAHLGAGAQFKRHHEDTFRVYRMKITGADEETWARPYVSFLNSPTIQYGETDKLKDVMQNQNRLNQQNMNP